MVCCFDREDTRGLSPLDAVNYPKAKNQPCCGHFLFCSEKKNSEEFLTCGYLDMS